MRDCFSLSFRQSHDSEKRHLTSQDSAGSIPISIPSPNIKSRFNNLIHTPSFYDIQTKICVVEDWENIGVIQYTEKVIEPNPIQVQKALELASSNPLSHPFSPYFTHTEKVCQLLLGLELWVHHTRRNYMPIKNLIKNLNTNSDSLNQEQCRSASEILLHFRKNQSQNPCTESHNLNDMHICSSNLKEHISGRQVKNRKPVCFTGPAIKVVIAALSALLRGSSFSTVPKISKQDIAYIGLLDKAANSALNLCWEVQTIEPLAKRAQTAIENDRGFIQNYVGEGADSFYITRVVDILAKNSENTSGLLRELEVHICRCFKCINEGRRSLLEQINQVRSL